MSNYKLLATFISMMNFLYYLLIVKNLIYLYVEVGSDEFFHFLIFLKISFAGFILGLLLFNKIINKYPKISINKLHFTLSYIILSVSLFNYFEISNAPIIHITSICVTFLPALFYGFIYAAIIKKLGKAYHKTLFYLLIGTSLAVIVYNYLFVYIPFIFIYFILFLIFQFCLIRSALKIRILTLVLAFFAFIFLAKEENYGQIYSAPYNSHFDYKALGYKHVKTIMGPYGVLDVLYSPKLDTYLTLSDKVSPSVIAVKDKIEDVQEHVKIPYFVKNYDKSLIIGVGGGQDLVAGLHFGTKNITAVEIDKQRISLLKSDFKNYSNKLLYDERINVIVDSGRAYLRKNSEKFDLINIQRPWTGKVSNAFIYDTSKELFTEEALDAYLNAINEEGIIFLGLPDYLNNDSTLVSLKKNIDRIKDNLLIFFPYYHHRLVAVLISKGYDLMQFYTSYKDEYEFAYYPLMNIDSKRNEVVDYLFFEDKVKESIDKNLKIFNRKKMNQNFITVVAILLFLFIASLLEVRFLKNFTHNKYTVYLFLGIGYEIVALFFIIWLSHFILNQITLLPFILMIYFLFGSFGYLHSGLVNKKIIFFICIVLATVFTILWQNNLLFSEMQSSLLKLLIVLSLFFSVSYLITFPFGYLVRFENKIERALSIDYIGSLVSVFIILSIPNLDYLLLFSVLIYLVIGILIIFHMENYSNEQTSL